MPTYEYECKKCKKTFEIFQSMKEDALQICPEHLCRMKKWGRGEVKRLLGTGAGLLFKGSGFYITDYRSEGYKQAAKKDTAAPAASDGGSSESKKKDTPAKETPKKSTGEKKAG
jgi:putative FmdB family regulatory protein